jgi:hypothetical protein
MLSFYFIPDEQSNTTSAEQLKYAGGIEEEEFEMAQKAGLIESYADYYGKFRWSGKQVLDKINLLASCPFRAGTELNGILAQARAAGLGLIAFGD